MKKVLITLFCLNFIFFFFSYCRLSWKS